MKSWFTETMGFTLFGLAIIAFFAFAVHSCTADNLLVAELKLERAKAATEKAKHQPVDCSTQVQQVLTKRRCICDFRPEGPDKRGVK